MCHTGNKLASRSKPLVKTEAWLLIPDLFPLQRAVQSNQIADTHDITQVPLMASYSFNLLLSLSLATSREELINLVANPYLRSL